AKIRQSAVQTLRLQIIIGRVAGPEHSRLSQGKEETRLTWVICEECFQTSLGLFVVTGLKQLFNFREALDQGSVAGILRGFGSFSGRVDEPYRIARMRFTGSESPLAKRTHVRQPLTFPGHIESGDHIDKEVGDVEAGTLYIA